MPEHGSILIEKDISTVIETTVDMIITPSEISRNQTNKSLLRLFDRIESNVCDSEFLVGCYDLFEDKLISLIQCRIQGGDNPENNIEDALYISHLTGWNGE